jgi:hypothetical protein
VAKRGCMQRGWRVGQGGKLVEALALGETPKGSAGEEIVINESIERRGGLRPSCQAGKTATESQLDQLLH